MEQKQKFFVKPETILKYLITDDDATDTLITCKSSQVSLLTTDFDVHKALASVKEDDKFNFNKLKKLFEAVEIISYVQLKNQRKPIIKQEDVEKIRKLALGVNQNDWKEK